MMMTTPVNAVQILCTIIAATGVCAFSWFVKLLVNRYWNSKQCAPAQRRRYGPKSWPIVGTLVEHFRNWYRLHDWLCSYFEEYHTFAATLQFGIECYYTVDIENIKYILKTNFKNFPKGVLFQERMKDLLGDGIFNTDGEKWKQQRKTASTEFSMRVMRDFYAAVFTEEALKVSHLLDEIVHQGVSVDMQDLFMRMTLESIGKVGLGVEIGTLLWQLPLPDNTFAKAFDFANDTVCRRFIDPLWKWKQFLKVGYEAELAEAIKVLDSFTYGVIAQRKLDINTARNQQAEGVPLQALKMDIITRFLLLAEEEKNNIDYKLLRDIVLNFIIAGRDTTAVTLSWFVHSIMEKPEIAQRLYEELRDFETRKTPLNTSGNVPNGRTACVDRKVQEFAKLLTYANLKPEELPYLQAVISETLRLFPAVPQDPKGILADDVLPDGTPVRRGRIITYSPYCMGRMTYIWGPDAKEFKPERWLRSGVFIPESEFKFTAFQAGLRTCLGRDSAYTQLKITAAILCRFFEFELVKGHQVHYRMMAILSMVNGIKVNVKRREEAASIGDKITQREPSPA